jgi:predicted Zn finger-like uncharacterized protein
MPIVISCPSCAAQLRVPEDLLGTLVRCPTCQTTFTAAPSGPTATVSPVSDARAGLRTEPSEPQRPDEDSFPSSRRFRLDEPFYGRADRGVLVLVLGIVGLVIAAIGACVVPYVLEPIGFGLSLTAWILGRLDLRAMQNGDMDPRGKDMTKASWICGIIGTCIAVLAALLYCGLILFVVVMMIATGGK